MATEVNQSQYLDFSIKTAIAILASLSFNDIKSFRKSTINFQAVLLSQISDLNGFLEDILDNSVSIVCDNYIDELNKKIADINKFTMSVDDVYSYKNSVDKIHDMINEYLSEDINKDAEEFKGVLSFLFTTTERDSLIDATMLPIKYDANEAGKFKNDESSMSNTFIEQISNILTSFSEKINDVVNIEEEISAVAYATTIAFYIWFKICNSSNDKLNAFLNKDFRDIKEEITNLVESGVIING